MGGNKYIVTSALDIIFPTFGKNLTIPYAAIDDMTIAIIVTRIAIHKLLLIFSMKFRSLITCVKFSKVNFFGRILVGLADNSPADFTEERSTHSNGKNAITDETIKYIWHMPFPNYDFSFPITYPPSPILQ